MGKWSGVGEKSTSLGSRRNGSEDIILPCPGHESHQGVTGPRCCCVGTLPILPSLAGCSPGTARCFCFQQLLRIPCGSLLKKLFLTQTLSSWSEKRRRWTLLSSIMFCAITEMRSSRLSVISMALSPLPRPWSSATWVLLGNVSPKNLVSICWC